MTATFTFQDDPASDVRGVTYAADTPEQYADVALLTPATPADYRQR